MRNGANEMLIRRYGKRGPKLQIETLGFQPAVAGGGTWKTAKVYLQGSTQDDKSVVVTLSLDEARQLYKIMHNSDLACNIRNEEK